QDADRVSAPSSSAEPAIPSIRGLFGDIVTDFRRLPSRQTLGWLGVGATAALFSHAEDKAVMRGFAPTASLNTTAGAGDTIGSTPFQLGAAVATYSIGRLTNSPRAAALGADLIRAQVVAETTTLAIKYSVGRVRPDGTGYSFPSGHAAA